MQIRRMDGDGDWDRVKAVRFKVFVDEQAVPADEELDANDADARHWLAEVDGAVIGTARVVDLIAADGTPYGKIGRVAVLADHRGTGVGVALMRAILAELAIAGPRAAYLESQTHAIGFYERLGFVAEGEEFLDAGIPHRRMWRRDPANRPAWII